MIIDILKTMNKDQVEKRNPECSTSLARLDRGEGSGNSYPPRVSKHCSVATASCSSCKRSSRLNSAAGLAVVDLLAPLAALVGPREMGDGNDEEGVAGVGNTGKGVVPMEWLVEVRRKRKDGTVNIPCGERSEDTKGSPGSQETSVRSSGAAVVEVSQAEEEECEIKREEEHEEGDG
jgi:hypothetical protein